MFDPRRDLRERAEGGYEPVGRIFGLGAGEQAAEHDQVGGGDRIAQGQRLVGGGDKEVAATRGGQGARHRQCAQPIGIGLEHGAGVAAGVAVAQ